MRVHRFYPSAARGIGLSLILAWVASVAEARTWTESETGRTLEGDLVRVVREIALIRRSDGTMVQVPLTRLSEADRAFIQAQQAATAVPPVDPKDQGREELRRQLLGTWEGSIVNRDGSPQGGIVLVITEQEITASNGPGLPPIGTGTFAVASSARGLHRIDTKGTSGQYDGKDYQGIFSIEGRTLRWCSTNDRSRGNRPEALQTDLPSGHFLMVLERK